MHVYDVYLHVYGLVFLPCRLPGVERRDMLGASGCVMCRRRSILVQRHLMLTLFLYLPLPYVYSNFKSLFSNLYQTIEERS